MSVIRTNADIVVIYFVVTNQHNFQFEFIKTYLPDFARMIYRCVQMEIEFPIQPNFNPRLWPAREVSCFYNFSNISKKKNRYIRVFRTRNRVFRPYFP